MGDACKSFASFQQGSGGPPDHLSALGIGRRTESPSSVATLQTEREIVPKLQLRSSYQVSVKSAVAVLVPSVLLTDLQDGRYSCQFLNSSSSLHLLQVSLSNRTGWQHHFTYSHLEFDLCRLFAVLAALLTGA